MTAAPLAQDGQQNRLLAVLSPEEYEPLRSHLRPIACPVKHVLHAAGTPVLQVYFPGSGMISQVMALADGSVVEVTVTGKEGMVGLAATVSGWIDPSESFAQLPGQGLQMEAAAFRGLATAGSRLALLVQRYTQAQMIQKAQGAACN